MTAAATLLAIGVRPVEGSSAPHAGSLSEATREFEALLLAQILRSVRESAAGGWSGEETEESGGLMLELAEQQLAKAMAARGCLGIAGMAESALSAQRSPADRVPGTPDNSTGSPTALTTDSTGSRTPP